MYINVLNIFYGPYSVHIIMCCNPFIMAQLDRNILDVFKEIYLGLFPTTDHFGYELIWIFNKWSRDSVTGVATRLRGEWSRAQIPAGTINFPFFKSQNRLWGAPSFLFFPGGTGLGAWCWPVTSIQRRGWVHVELYRHFSHTPSWCEKERFYFLQGESVNTFLNLTTKTARRNFKWLRKRRIPLCSGLSLEITRFITQTACFNIQIHHVYWHSVFMSFIFLW